MKKIYYGLVGVIMAMAVSSLYAATADVKVKLNTADGSTTFAVQDSTPVPVATVDSYGNLTLAKPNGLAELRMSNSAATFYTGFKDGGSTATRVYALPTTDGTSNTFMQTDGAGKLRWGSPYVLVATQATDIATAADVNPVTLTGLVFTYETNSMYRIWFMGRVSPALATTGCAFQFDLSSAVNDICVSFYHQLANTGTLSGGHSIGDDASIGNSSGLPGTSTYPVVGNGILRTAGNTGTAQLRFRSETAAAAVITAKAGFTLVVEKIQ